MPDVAASLTVDATAADVTPADASGHSDTGGLRGDVKSQADAQRVFSVALMVSAVRCVLTYLLLPFAAPVLGFAAGVGPAVGMAIGAVAITANGFSIRRFHRACHRWRWAYTAVAVGVIVLLAVMMVRDFVTLL